MAIRADLKECNLVRILDIIEPTIKGIKIGFVYGDNSVLQLSKLDIDAVKIGRFVDMDEEYIEGIEKSILPTFSSGDLLEM